MLKQIVTKSLDPNTPALLKQFIRDELSKDRSEAIQALQEAVEILNRAINTAAFYDSTKKFMFKDLTGRGIVNNDLTMIDLNNMEDEQDYNDDWLHMWAEECEEGDEWESSRAKFICTHD